MLDKYFVPYNRAKKLKSLKFKEECFGYYIDVEVPNPFLVKNIVSDDQGGYFTLAPTFEQIFDWFREKYNSSSFVKRDFKDAKLKGYYYGIEDTTEDFYSKTFKTFEEAQLACLDKLIEICEKSVF